MTTSPIKASAIENKSTTTNTTVQSRDTNHEDITSDLMNKTPDSDNAKLTNKQQQDDARITSQSITQTPSTKLSTEHIGFRIVSPGLPPLSAEMNKMVDKSKNIEEQQRKLIAKKRKELAKPDASVADTAASAPLAADEKGQYQAQGAGQDQDQQDDDFIHPIQSPKRLKRDKLPTPLQLNSNTRSDSRIPSALHNPHHHPHHHAIHHHGHHQLPATAPVRGGQRKRFIQQQQPQVTPGVGFGPDPGHAIYPYYPMPYHGFPMPPPPQAISQSPQHMMAMMHPYQHPFPYSYAYSYPPSQVPFPQPHPLPAQPLAAMPGQQARLKTHRVSFRVPPHDKKQLNGGGGDGVDNANASSGLQNNKKSVAKPVIDVYPEGIQREAPIQAQPLSAQRATFGENRFKATPTKQEELEEPEQEEPESESEEQEQEMDIEGEIRLNHDVFYYNANSQDKELFMKLCSTIWDEYTR